MNRARFRYALEPVLLARRWALDALMLTLAQHNAQIAAMTVDLATARSRYQAAGANWSEVAAATEAQPVQRFAMNARYLCELASQVRTHTERMAALEAARDDIVAQALLAQRAVEAAEKHRGRMQELFVQKRASADFKLADDQWNTLQAGAANNGH